MKAVLSEKNVHFEFVDLMSSMTALKSYLVMRDTCEAFKDIRGTRVIGIPLMVVDGEPYMLSGEGRVDQLIRELGLTE